MAFERMAYLEAVIGADITQFRKGMRDIRNEVGVLSETLGGLSGLGRTLTYTVTAPMMAFGSMAVQQAGDFEAAMRNINSIVGLSEEELAGLSSQVLEFGKNTRGGAMDSASALYTVFSAGILDTATAFNIMEVSSRTAEAGLADLEVTTQSIIATQLAYGDTTAEMTDRVSNSLTMMVQLGVGSMDEFAHAVGNLVPNANALGIEVEELYGTMAVLTQRGVSAATASTNLTNAMSSMVKPTEAMQAAFQELGVSGAEELITQFGGLSGALKALVGTTDGTQESINALFNNIRGARAVNSLFGDVAGWDETMQNFMASLDGATMRAWDEQMKSFAAQWDLLQSALQGAAITIGNQLLPMVTPLVMGLTDLVIGFTELDPSIIQMGLAIGGVVAAAAPLMWLLGGLVAAFNPLTIGIALAATAIVTNWAIIVEAFSGAATQLSGIITPLQEMLGGLWEGLTPEDVTMQTPEVALEGEPTTIDPMSIITVDTTKSLWQIFTEQGYDDYFSWQEFMRLAEEGGWNGGAVEVGTEITIDMSGVRTVPPTMPLVEVGAEAVDMDAAAIEQELNSTWGNVDWQAMFDDLNFDYAASGFGDLVGGITDLIDELSQADWTGLALLGTELISIGSILIGGVASGIGDILSGIGTSLRAVIDVVSDIAEGDYEGAVTNLILAFAGFGGAIINTALTTLETMVAAVNELFNLEIPNLSEWFDGVRASIDAGINDARAALSNEGEPITSTIPVSITTSYSMANGDGMEIMDFADTGLGTAGMTFQDNWFGDDTPQITVTVPADIDWSPETVNTVLDVAAVAHNMDLSEAERQAANELLNAWSTAMSPEDQAAFMSVLNSYYSSAANGGTITPDGWTFTIENGEIVATIAPSTTTTLEGEPTVQVPVMNVEAQAAMAIANGWMVDTSGTTPVATLADGEVVQVDAPIELVSTEGIATSFTQDLAEGMDAETIVATYLTPIETKWNEMFAPEGLMTTNLSLFVEGLTTNATLIDTQALAISTSFETMTTSAIQQLNRLAARGDEVAEALGDELGGAVLAIGGVIRGLNSLILMEGVVDVKINIGTSGTVLNDGEPHKNGLSNVPYDGYQATLHKDERVLTARENRDYNDQMSAATIIGTQGGNTVNQTTNQINVGTNLSVDDVLFELDRMGYRLERK
jgi:TP901 family phage tail tape measure protein